MSDVQERVVKPPLPELVDGRIFRPVNALLYKIWLKMLVASVLVYFVFLFSFFGPPLVTVVVFEFIPFNLWFVQEGWVVGSLVYWILTPFWLVPAIIWALLYVRSIEYGVVGWDGEAMPDIYQRKGILNKVKKHTPFRNIIYIRTRAGPFDRLFGIGSVIVETAGEEGRINPTGVLTLILSAFVSRGSRETNIGGIRFYKEIERFIVRELRIFDKAPAEQIPSSYARRRKRIFSHKTLQSFQVIRDVLKEQTET